MKISKLMVLLLCTLLPALTHAQSEKPALVLLPVQGPNLSAGDSDNYRIALQEALKRDYQVYSGGEVEKRLQKSSAKTCNATECLQEVAISFQGELISRLVVTPSGDGYLLAVEIKNIFDDQLIFARNIPCEGCNNFAVIRTLRSLEFDESTIADNEIPDLGSSQNRVAEAEEDSGTSWWVYLLGAVLVGAAAGGGGGGGGDPADTAAPTGEITVTW